MGRTVRWRLSKPAWALIIATIALSITQPYVVLAQNVAGKIATRTKLVDDGTTTKNKKKKRSFSFWGGKTAAQQKVVNVDGGDGEYSFWSRKRNKKKEGSTNNKGDESSWTWELFYAETKMIIVSVITSVLCAVLSWIWYARPILCRDDVKKTGEEGGEWYDLNHDVLPPFLPFSAFFRVSIAFL